MEKQALLSCCEKAGIPFLQKEPMKNHTTFRIGGPAECMLLPETEGQLFLLLQVLQEEGCQPFYLGRGSNLLVRDEGISQPVIHLGLGFGGEIRKTEGTKIFCPAGKKLSDLCLFARDQGLSGLEFAYGIPGSVGGAAYMNAGAYGGEMKDVICAVRYLDCSGTAHTMPAGEMDFSYRHSIFCEPERKGCCITGAEFSLKRGEKEGISRLMEDILERRKSKQPLDFPSAGSTFKRPEGAFASALIDQCGLKGFSVGGAAVSEKHAGFVINKKEAACRDVLDLIGQVQEIVQEKTGFRLECEVKIIPEEAEG